MSANEGLAFIIAVIFAAWDVVFKIQDLWRVWVVSK